MIKSIDCPICENGKLDIELKENEKVVTNGRFGKFPYRCYCKNCRRFIKYNIVKNEG